MSVTPSCQRHFSGTLTVGSINKHSDVGTPWRCLWLKDVCGNVIVLWIGGGVTANLICHRHFGSQIASFRSPLALGIKKPTPLPVEAILSQYDIHSTGKQYFKEINRTLELFSILPFALAMRTGLIFNRGDSTYVMCCFKNTQFPQFWNFQWNYWQPLTEICVHSNMWFVVRDCSSFINCVGKMFSKTEKVCWARWWFLLVQSTDVIFLRADWASGVIFFLCVDYPFALWLPQIRAHMQTYNYQPEYTNYIAFMQIIK